MSAGGAALLAIGVGNVLMGDDGAGVRALEAMRSRVVDNPGALPPDARLLDGGTLGLDLVRQLHGVRGLVLLDAAVRGREPGTITVRRGRDAIAAVTDDVAGDHGLGELVSLASLLDVLPSTVAVVEIEAGRIEMGSDLSPEVWAAVPEAALAACRELTAMAVGAGA